jgi:hypothetical protein
MVPSRNERNDESIIRELAEFKDTYLPLDKDRLVLFATGFLESKDIEPTYDKIVVAVFRLFPKKFCLVGFPEYPDGETVHCCLLHCTNAKKWLSGNTRSAFGVTERGRYFLNETKKMLEGKILLTKKYSIQAKRKEFTFLNLLKTSEAYRKFEQGRKDEISDSEILEALRVQPESRDLAEKHAIKYSDYAKRMNETSIIQFLEFVKEKWRGK